MKTLLILGAGTGGTMVANKMAKELDHADWKIIIVDQDDTHGYQPGLLFVPFGTYTPDDTVAPRKRQLGKRVAYVQAPIDRVETDEDRVYLADGQTLDYDVLINTTRVGLSEDVSPVPSETLREDALVMDAVYDPPRTRLLRDARARGARTVGGKWWLVHQAAEQLTLWSQLAAPIRSAGVVLSQPTISTTPSTGLARMDSSTSHPQ